MAWKRIARRWTTSDGSSDGAPCTWQRKPSSAYWSAREMPDFASRSEARTSWVLLPIDETMPIPVTTTRLMKASHASQEPRSSARPSPSAAARCHRRFVAEQTDFEVECPIDDRAVRRQPAVRDAEHEFRAHDPLDID